MTYEIEVSNDWTDINTDGTSFHGNAIRLPYPTLVDLLGEPSDSDGYKVDAEWLFRDKTGAVATLYNWKNGPNYTGQGQIEDIKYWHIGGHESSQSLITVMRALVERGIDKDIPLNELLENTQMKDLSIMTPAELQRAVNQLEQTLYMDKAGNEKPEVTQLRAVNAEILKRKKIWRPDVLKIVQSTGRATGTFNSKYETPIGWKHKIRNQPAQIIDVVSFDIII